MKSETREQVDAYYQDAESWAADRLTDLQTSRRRAWFIGGIMAFVAISEAIALMVLLPLKTIEPYTLLVDRQTGHVEALRPLDASVITPDEALTRSFLVQYVIARETFDIATLQQDYRRAVLWSDGEARGAYISDMLASNPQSPLSRLPRNTVVEVEIKSISMLSDSSSMIRYSLVRRDRGAQPRSLGNRVSILSWTYSGEPMTMADRLVNPLGFQVTRYRSDVEALPEINQSTGEPNSTEIDTIEDSVSDQADTPDGIRRIGNRTGSEQEPSQ